MSDATKFITDNPTAVQTRVNQILEILQMAKIGPTRTTLAAMQVIGSHFEDAFEGTPAGEGGKKKKDGDIEPPAMKAHDLDDLIAQLEQKE